LVSFKKKLISLLSILQFVILGLYNCKKEIVNEAIPQELEYEDSSSNKSFLPPSNKKVEPFLKNIDEIESKLESFEGDLNLKIIRYDVQEKLNISGKIFFEKEGKKLKIQLFDPFFGMIISQILADPFSIQIKGAGNDKIFSQGMENFMIKDPQTNREFRIPFPVIFQIISLNFRNEFTKPDTLINPAERKVKIKKNTDEFHYTFIDEGLDSLEYFSPEKNFQTKTKISETNQKGVHPPNKILTRITDITQSKDLSLVETNLKNLKKVKKIDDKIFRF
jgi:hypothetical protein